MLISQINPNEYDYKPEWISFWSKRMKEVCNKAIETKKQAFREKFSLSKDYRQISGKKRRSHSPEKYLYCVEISSDESFSDGDSSHRSKQARLRSPQGKYYESTCMYYKSPSREQVPDEPVTMVTVLRLLSALETELGCLSSNILDLLSKALALEKQKPNSSDELLMTTENSVFLETVKEKMKGLLLVNLLPPQKIAAVKKCIQNIAKLIHQTPINDPKPEKNEENEELAKEIAEALKAQGKEDCTSQELEVLVEMFLKPSEIEPVKESYTNFDDLDDNDLKILLANFHDLDKDEQDHVIKFLSVLEQRDPERVNFLRQFVKISEVPDESENQEPMDLDDDPDDYNFSEVVQSVVANVEASPGSSLTDNLLTFGKNRW